MIVYGIKNCSTVKKALDWLKKRKLDFEFHDYKTQGIESAKLKGWINQLNGWEDLVNKKGTTWRQLSDTKKTTIKNKTAAIELMMEKPTVIRRPLIEGNGKILALGFDETSYKSIF